MKNKKKIHDYSKVLDKLEALMQRVKFEEESFKHGDQYIKAHDKVIEYNTLYSVCLSVALMQWEK